MSLPDPKSRKESYLAKAAGMAVTVPEKPESREEEYLAAIAAGGGGGGTSDFDQLENRPKYNGTAMTGETNIPLAPSVVQETGTSETSVMSQNATTGLVGKSKELTINDYNWNSASQSGTGTPNCIALWKLDVGIYHINQNDGNPVYSMLFKGGSRGIYVGDYIISPSDASGYKIITGIITNSSNIYIYYVDNAGNKRSSASINPTDNLTSTSVTAPLSANQGKVLKDTIDGLIISKSSAPTTSTAGVLGQLYTDTTDMHTYQCTAISGDTYTWTQRW